MSTKIGKFEDLEVWKEGMRLAEKVYQSLHACHDFGLRDQMQRAAISIPSNIAEGYERDSNREFIRYLFIASGSCAELRTQVYLCLKIGILHKTEAKKLLEATKMISAMLHALIKTRKARF